MRLDINKYWVPSEGLNDASSGNCRIVMWVPNECLKDSSSGKCGIIIQVPNECLKDSSSGKMQDSNAAVGRLNDTTERAYKKIITAKIQEVGPSQGYSILYIK